MCDGDGHSTKCGNRCCTLTEVAKKAQKLEVQEQLDEMKLDTVPPAGADADVSDAMTPKMVKKEKKRLTREMASVRRLQALFGRVARWSRAECWVAAARRQHVHLERPVLAERNEADH